MHLFHTPVFDPFSVGDAHIRHLGSRRSIRESVVIVCLGQPTEHLEKAFRLCGMVASISRPASSPQTRGVAYTQRNSKPTKLAKKPEWYGASHMNILVAMYLLHVSSCSASFFPDQIASFVHVCFWTGHASGITSSEMSALGAIAISC